MRVCYGLLVPLGSCLALLGTLLYSSRVTLLLLVAAVTAIELSAASWLRWRTTSPLHVTAPLSRAAGLLVVSVMFFHTMAVLFGVPLVENAEETLLFGVHLTSLTVLPLLLSGSTHCSLAALQRTLLESREGPYELRLGALGALAGAWLGCVVLPLDWDRPWQKWPIPCVVGSLVGRSLALTFSCFQAHR